jgi:hypothetical protein
MIPRFQLLGVRGFFTGLFADDFDEDAVGEFAA